MARSSAGVTFAQQVRDREARAFRRLLVVGAWRRTTAGLRLMQTRIALVSGAILLASCASTQPTTLMPSDAEVEACKAQGGSIEPAHAINTYVCLMLPDGGSGSAGTIDYGTLRENPSSAGVGSVIDQMPSSGAGEHHVELTYCTNVRGVVLPPDIRALYPTEITVVLQWQYWGLERTGDDIRVTVSFNQQPAGIVIPLRAITTFRAPDEGIDVRLRPGETSDQRCPDSTNYL